MTAHSLWDVQSALYTELTNAGALTALLAAGNGSILDHVPPGTVFPYVVIGDMALDSLDTHEFYGSEIHADIHVYSRGSGLKQTREILSEIYNALHDQDFTVTNHALVLCHHTGTDTALDADGMTRRGTIRFRIVTEPTS